MHRPVFATFLLAPLLACGGANYPSDEVYERSYVAGGDTDPLPCRPDLDGEIADAEMPVLVGAALRFLVSTDAPVNLPGHQAEGTRSWELGEVGDDDAVLDVDTRPLGTIWFADRVPAESYLVPLDASGSLLGIMERRAGALITHGTASAEQNPASGQTLLLYDSPVDLFRLPLAQGRSWSQEVAINDGRVQGLPVAARHSYRVEVLREGRLVLPDLTFDRVLQVAVFVHQETVVGPPTDWVQVSYLAECYGEVARATSAVGETSADFTTAAELRRLIF